MSLSDSAPVRVMVVDDDPAFRRLCGVALETEGIEHVAVGSSVEALGPRRRASGASST